VLTVEDLPEYELLDEKEEYPAAVVTAPYPDPKLFP
jgi:hypothetical protein